MDEPETTLVATSRIAGAMNYPSTTQALFALIVMIIVLLFILVYCCWGTFTCVRHQDAASAPSAEEGMGPGNQRSVRRFLHRPHTVFMPVNNMIYVGDPETQQIYHIPMNRDKPPAYTDVFCTGPPPPYRTATSETELNTSPTTHREQQESMRTLPENPPTYTECLSAASQESAIQLNSMEASHPGQEQQQQEEAAAYERPTDTPVCPATESLESPAPEPIPQIQESPPTKTDLILTVNTLPRVPSQLAEEESIGNSIESQHTQDGQSR